MNYRCPPPVVDGARMLLAHNRRRVSKVIRAGRQDSPEFSDSLQIEKLAGEAVAPHTTDLIDIWLAEGAPPESIAVLCRVNSGLLPVQVLADDRGLPVTAAVGEQFLRRTGVRSALTYLRLACSVADGGQLSGTELAEIVRRPNRRITAKVIDAIRNRRRWTISTLRAQAELLNSADTDRVHLFADDLEGLGALVESGDAAAIAAIDPRRRRPGRGDGHARQLGPRPGLVAPGRRDRAPRDCGRLHPDPATFELWLREHLQGVAVGDDPRAAGQVTLSTVHRVKGLEWERVIVLGADEGLMPHRLTDDIEEERRVFHVALTRCRTQVVLLADAAAPTPFIEDLTTEPAPILAAVPGEESRLERSRRTAPSGAFVAPAAAAGENSELVDALRAWRLERSRSDGVPAFVVLHDSTIQEIAAAKPASARELSRITGIGPTKLERYGSDILEIVGTDS